MNSTIISFTKILLPLALLTAGIAFMYHRILCPILTDFMAYRIFRLRDRLRRYAIEGELSANSWEYSFTESRINRALQLSETLEVWDIYLLAAESQEGFFGKDYERFKENGSEELMDIYLATMGYTFAIAFVSSPLWMVLVACVYVLTRQSWNRLKEWATEATIYTVESQPIPASPHQR